MKSFKRNTFTQMYTKEEAQAIRHEFWHKLESKSRRAPGQNGKPIHWMMDKTGIRGLDLRFDLSGGRVMVGIEINTHSEEKDKKLWEKLVGCKILIEKNFEEPLTWDPEFVREAGNTVHRAYVSTEGDIYNKDKWPEMLRFMIDNMMRMEKAYRSIQDYMMHF